MAWQIICSENVFLHLAFQINKNTIGENDMTSTKRSLFPMKILQPYHKIG